MNANETAKDLKNNQLCTIVGITRTHFKLDCHFVIVFWDGGRLNPN
jgi:hypothetical protein